MVAVSIILIGITAMASQIIFMRELLVVFYGNELSIGFIFASWLIGGAIGSGILGRFSDRIKYKITVFGLSQIFLAILLPLEIIAIRAIKNVINILPGQIIPLASMAISSFIVLVPICLLLGFLFSLACRIYKTPGDVYILEGTGAVIGGLLIGSLLVRLTNPVSIMGILAASNILISSLLLAFSVENRFRKISITIAVALFAAASLIFIFKGWDKIEARSLKDEWRGYDLIASNNSVYGNIVLTKRLGQFSFFDNGLHLYTIPDKEKAEESVHFALLEDPNPEALLLIGGGAGGLIEEALKHPLKKIDYVELDPLIVEMAKAYLPKEYSSPLLDRRVKIENTDGRFFIKRTRGRYDCIIINVGDPFTAQLNRYYTHEFFEEAKRILKRDGVIAFGLTSSENYINEELGNFLSSIYATLKKSFKDILVIPGDTVYFLATDKEGILTYDYNTLMERARSRKIDLRYVREYYLSSRMSPQRISYIEKIVKYRPGMEINYDFRPVSYYYNTAFWATRFRGSLFTNILKWADVKMVWVVIFTSYGLVALFGIFNAFRKRSFERMALVSLAGAGLTSMAVQIIIMLAFQFVYGYLFYKLSMIMALFMTGLVAGGWCSIRIMPRLKDPRAVFLLNQCAFAIYPLIMSFLAWQSIAFTILPALAGFVGGFQFPLANHIYTKGGATTGKAAGLTYGIDLAGSCLGALLTASFLIPLLGVPQACLALAGLNFAVLSGLIFSFCRNNI